MVGYNASERNLLVQLGPPFYLFIISVDDADGLISSSAAYIYSGLTGTGHRPLRPRLDRGMYVCIYIYIYIIEASMMYIHIYIHRHI